ncbi:hypothetical protein J6590_002224 [Homalodisca vitripennis]|nr:hypothetical protein J6590_002224 [Homalodisca vitripennis]
MQQQHSTYSDSHSERAMVYQRDVGSSLECVHHSKNCSKMLIYRKLKQFLSCLIGLPAIVQPATATAEFCQGQYLVGGFVEHTEIFNTPESKVSRSRIA